jgi:DNA polymerase I-like protein with 3'-5' exonuclease and polymerase domains
LLWSELSASSANVYVPLGPAPLYSLTRRGNAQKRRGSILTSIEECGSRKVIPTLHPKSSFAQYLNTYFITHDLKKVGRECNCGKIHLPERELRIRPSYTEVLCFLSECKLATELAFDIECGKNGRGDWEVTCISFCPTAHTGMSIPFTENNGDYFTPPQERDIWIAIAAILEDPRIVKIGQNIIFDITFLYRKYGIRTENHRCTMVASKMIFPDFPAGLDFLTSYYTNEPYYKDEGKKWFKFAEGQESFWLYNAKDSAVCVEIWDRQKRDLEMLGNTEAYERQNALIPPLVYMQEHGILVNRTGLTDAAKSAEVEIARLTEELHSVCGEKLNPNSPKQLCEYFYFKKKNKIIYKRGTQNMTTDVKALRLLSGKGSKEAKLILDIRKLAKMKGTYYEVGLDEDNRLRCSFSPGGTKSGRLSSSQSIFEVGCNFQNMPPAFKKYLLCDPGYLLFNIDLSAAENRVVAYIAPEPNMMECFELGQDMHKKTAALLFGKSMEDISDEKGSCEIGGGAYSERFWGKKANHSLNYDLGFRSFAFQYEIPEPDAKFLVDRYHQAYPGVRAYHSWVQYELQKGRKLTDAFGKSRTFLGRWGDSLFKEAYSYIPQSTVAGKMNRDGVLFVWENPSIFEQVELLNTVHDSIGYQLPLTAGWDYMASVLLTLKESLTSEISWGNTKFHIPIDAEVGLTFGHTIKVKLESRESIITQLKEAYSTLTHHEEAEVAISAADIDDDILLDDEEEQPPED